MAAARSFSFELFPPRTAAAAERLPATVRELAAVGPAYFSVTFGAGGSDQAGTYDTVIQVARDTGIEAAPHLTCVGSTRGRIRELLDRYRDAGIRRLVALRGDLPATAPGAEAPGEFHFANELVAFIRESHGDHFTVEVAGYPEMHPQAPDPSTDFDNLVRKVRAGADAVITQYFFNPASYFDFRDRCSAAGLKVPVVPGIMPITNYAQLARFSDACGAEIPRWIRLRLEMLQDDRPALLEFGAEVVSQLCETLLAGGAPGLHFYSLNQAEPVLRLWKNLKLS